MGVSACARVEAACTPGFPAPESPFPQPCTPATSSFSGIETGANIPRLCAAPSLSQAEKLLLSPLTKRSRKASRLSAEIAPGCLEIDPREVRAGAKIGSGSWSVVFAGQWRGQKAAMKVFRYAGEDAQQEIRWQMFLKEASMLQQMDNPRMLKLFGVFIGADSSPCLVTELLEGGTLHQLLHGRRKLQGPALDPARRFLLALHIAEGLAYLHSRALPVVHRDMKSKNVALVTNIPDTGLSCAAKIIDFGFADYLSVDGNPQEMLIVEHGMQGSAVYMAPECFSKPFYLTAKVDVWAFGCVLAEICGGAPPHTECEDLQQVTDKLLVRRQGPDVPGHADLACGAPGDHSMQHVIEACFTFDVGERWSSAQVLEQLQGIAADRGFEPLESSRL